MVNVYSQFLQLIGLGKSLPLICQQQQRPNYKSRVYSAHTKGTPPVPSLGDRGGCATGPYRTYYIRPHYQDTESKQLYLIHRNKHREAAKMRRQRNMAQVKGQIKTPEKEVNEMEISNISDTEFKTLIIRMLKGHSEDLSSIKKI